MVDMTKAPLELITELVAAEQQQKQAKDYNPACNNHRDSIETSLQGKNLSLTK
jgi:hypothetical protein